MSKHETHPPLISIDDFRELADGNVVLLDASFTMPGVNPNAAELFASGHIPGAQFFDIETICDPASPLPHMLPGGEDFSKHAGALGVGNDTHVVVYDREGMMSAGRAWWMFRVFGHTKVSVLDGGLKAWLSRGLGLSKEISPVRPQNFIANFNPRLVADLDQVRTAMERSDQIVDARSSARFTGAEKEKRAGLRSGHIPGSFNVPFGLMSDSATGLMKTPQSLRETFEKAGLDLAQPVVASCGSGVTACALAFGFYLLGKEDVVVYDGAWSQWGSLADSPIATGVAQR